MPVITPSTQLNSHLTLIVNKTLSSTLSSSTINLRKTANEYSLFITQKCLRSQLKDILCVRINYAGTRDLSTGNEQQ